MKTNIEVAQLFAALSGTDISKKMNIPEMVFSKWKNGSVSPSDSEISEIAEYSNLPVEYVRGDKYILTNPTENWKYCDDYWEDYATRGELSDIPLMKHGKALFDISKVEEPAYDHTKYLCFEARDDKMSEKGIRQGNLVLFKRTFFSEVGKIVLVVCDGVPRICDYTKDLELDNSIIIGEYNSILKK